VIGVVALLARSSGLNAGDDVNVAGLVSALLMLNAGGVSDANALEFSIF
jgi:hypothetical protein